MVGAEAVGATGIALLVVQNHSTRVFSMDIGLREVTLLNKGSPFQNLVSYMNQVGAK